MPFNRSAYRNIFQPVCSLKTIRQVESKPVRLVDNHPNWDKKFKQVQVTQQEAREFKITEYGSGQNEVMCSFLSLISQFQTNFISQILTAQDL